MNNIRFEQIGQAGNKKKKKNENIKKIKYIMIERRTRFEQNNIKLV